MRSEAEMMELILDTARQDERIRAVVMNGSRTNPNAPRDPFQDFDIVYLVTDVAAIRDQPGWIDRFGERMILQQPEAMPNPAGNGHWIYLMQFMDGNRIDLSLRPVDRPLEPDSLQMILLDKDGLFPNPPPSSDRDYLPIPPTRKAFADCCNEFWWVSPCIAK